MTLAVLLLALTPVPGLAATGATLSSTGTARTTIAAAAACASGTPYATELLATTPAPTFWWRFGEPAGATAVADEGPGNLDGLVEGSSPATALTLGDPGLPQCDTTASAHLLGDPTGATGYVVLPAVRPEPTALTVAVWVQAAPGAQGGLFGFGDTETGASGASDRVLALDGSGRVTFRVETSAGPVTLHSSLVDVVTDDTPHLVVATIGPAGGGRSDLALYLDGTRVDDQPAQLLAAPFPGYWRTGDPGGPGAPAHLDELAVWEGGALTTADITALAASDHW